MKKQIIKEESVLIFFGQEKSKESERYSPNGQPNKYYFFKDRIIIEKNKLLGIEAEQLEFTLSDQSIGSMSKLTNTYLYEVKEYDAVCYELVLIDFKVELVR
jgi:hypothetical protein